MILKVIGAIVLFIAVFCISTLVSIVSTVSKPLKLLEVPWSAQVGRELKDLPYENEYGNCYDLYLPANLDTTREHALVLYIHGGGFTGGSKSSGEKWCKYLVSHGYLAATMDYTVSNKEHTSDLNRMNREIDACVTAIYEKCAERGYKVTQMATAGDSAGGCLAMLYAYTQRVDAAIPVKFVCEQTGPAHFDPVGWNNAEEDYAAQAAFIKMMTGKEVTADMVQSGESEGYVAEISPAYLVTDTTVPTLCAYGPKDKVVPTGLKYQLFDAFEAHGVSYDFIEYPNSNHGMYGDLDKQEAYIARMLEYCKTYFGY